MSREEFEKLVGEGVLLIPEKFRERIRNVALLVEDEPSEEVRIREGLSGDETLLGLYQGIPATARGDFYGVGPTLPDTITLFKLPIEAAAHNVPERVRTIVAETIWHEVAHYFGMEEDEVRSREDMRTPHLAYTECPPVRKRRSSAILLQSPGCSRRSRRGCARWPRSY